MRFTSCHRVPSCCTLSYNYVSDTTFAYKNKIDIIANLISDKDILAQSNDTIYKLITVLDSIYSSDFRIQTLYTDYFLKSKKYEKAREKLVFLVTNYKTTMPFWEQLIYVLNSLNDFETMLKYCNQGIDVFGNKPIFFLYKGIALYNLKRCNEAIPVFNEGLRISDNSRDFKIQFYTYLGESYHSVKNYALSDTFFIKAIHLEPNNIFILNNYSFYLAERNFNLVKALEYIKICLDVHPNSFTYLDTYGWILYKMGKLPGAKKVLESSIKNGGIKDKDILGHYIIVLSGLGESENALKYYNYLNELGEPGNEIKALFQKN
jgi:tetratricopeptide (TPR) repeat protein